MSLQLSCVPSSAWLIKCGMAQKIIVCGIYFLFIRSHGSRYPGEKNLVMKELVSATKSGYIRLYPCELWAEKKPRNTRLFHGLSEPGGGGLDQGCTTVRTLVHVISNSVSVYILYKWSFGDGGARAGRLGGGGRGPHLIMTVEVVISNNNNNNNIYTTTSLYIYTRYKEIK